MSADSSTVYYELKERFHKVKVPGIFSYRPESTGTGTALPKTHLDFRFHLLFLSLRHFLRIAVIFGCVFASSARAEDTSQKLSHDSPSFPGRQLFSSNCAACHGLDGRGGERGPDIATRKEVQRLSDPALLHVIEAGVPGTGMPAFHSLDASGRLAIVHYLRALQGKQPEVAVPGNPQSGKNLFFGIAACSQCHMIKGAGGFIGSDLTSYAQTHSANEIRDIISRPDQYMGARARITVITTHDGKQYEGIIRNEDNFSLQLQSEEGAFHLLQRSQVERAEQQPKSLMPSDYGSRLTSQQLDDLISYLISTGREGNPGAKQILEQRKRSEEQ